MLEQSLQRQTTRHRLESESLKFIYILLRVSSQQANLRGLRRGPKRIQTEKKAKLAVDWITFLTHRSLNDSKVKVKNERNWKRGLASLNVARLRWSKKKRVVWPRERSLQLKVTVRQMHSFLFFPKYHVFQFRIVGAMQIFTATVREKKPTQRLLFKRRNKHLSMPSEMV